MVNSGARRGAGMLQDRAVVITGAGRGLGRDAAIHCAAYGAKIVVNDIDSDRVEATVEQIRSSAGLAVGSVHSVADSRQAREMIDLCVTAFGRIDGLVNNAALVSAELPWEATTQAVHDLVDVNVKGAMFAGIAALSHMRQQGDGVVVNTTSRAHAGISHQAVYAATKGAVASLTYNWAIEMAEHGVRVLGFSPRAKTRMWDNSVGTSLATPFGYHPDPSDVALLVPYLLSGLAHHLSGQVVRFDGRQLSILRQPVYDEVVVRRDSFTIEDIADAMQTDLRASIRPVGIDAHDLSGLTDA